MADNKVELKVTSDFRKIISDLEALQKKGGNVTEALKRVGDELDKNLQKNTKKTEQHFERLRDLGRRLADQLRGYFASIASQMAASLEGVKKDLGLKQQFMDATKGAIELHDVLRKIGGSLDIATGRLGEFQKNLIGAFSKAGFGADAAGRALQGIAGTQVSGEANAQGYALTSAKLAQAGGQEGQEGEIGKAMAGILRTRGIDQNNMGEMERLANSVRGRDPLGKLQGQQAMYDNMEPSQRGKFGPEAMRSFGAIRKEVGPEMDAFISKMTQGWLEKLPASAQGLGKIVDQNGINFKELNKNAPMLKRLGDDTNASGATVGLSPAEARGLYAMWKHSKAAQAAQDRARDQEGSLDEDVYERRGLGENAAAIKNRVGGKIQGVMAKPLGAVNDVLSGASKSDLGSAAVMGGGFLAVTAGQFALSQIAKKLGGPVGGTAEAATKAAALEQITGQKTMPVWVVNFSELNNGIGGLSGPAGAVGAAGGGKLGKVMGAIGTATIVGAVAYEVGSTVVDAIREGKSMHVDADVVEANKKQTASINAQRDRLRADAAARKLAIANAANDIARRDTDVRIRANMQATPSTDRVGASNAIVK